MLSNFLAVTSEIARRVGESTMDDRVILILHGWGGNKPEHWQEQLNTRLTNENVPVHYPKMPDPTAPDSGAWINCVRDELTKIQRHYPGVPLTVVAHSLGSITWVHLVGGLAAVPEPLADRVLLVAPPYIMPQAPPPDVPLGAVNFFPPPLNRSAIHSAARVTAMVASNTDDYATFDQSKGYATALDIDLHLLEGAGHISPYYGYGRWPWVEEWCLGKADFPPLPK